MTAFPVPDPPPSWYQNDLLASAFQGFYSLGDTPSFTTVNTDLPNAYQVKDWTGTVVSSGVVSASTVTPAAPTGGWKCGWYRLYLTGTKTDATFGSAYGSYSFCIVRTSANFPAQPGPADINNDHFAPSDGVSYNPVGRGLACIGPIRWKVGDISQPTVTSPTLTDVQNGVALEKANYSANGHTDAARPRPLFFSAAGAGIDQLHLLDAGSSPTTVFYCKTASLNGAQIFVKTSAATTTGIKVEVFSPNSTTLVETFDNNATGAALQTAVNATSAYVKAFSRTGALPVAAGPTAIGNGFKTGLTTVVTTLYPDITWFEGPINEPDTSNLIPEEAAHATTIYAGVVHAAAAGAKVMGPGYVDATLTSTATGAKWDRFFAAGGASGLDGLSFHAYNMLLGDPNLARATLTQFKALISSYSLSSLPLWQTEQGVYQSVYGVYHPRRSRWTMLQLLMQEQAGVPKEYNYLWYDMPYGFWGQPAHWTNGHRGVNPTVPLLRTYSDEVFGKTYTSAYNFGTPGNQMYVGNLYSGSDGTKLAVFCCHSPISGAQVILTVTGATSLTVSDAWGNTSTVPVVGGRATIPCTDVPAYVRLPTGATATVYSFGSWAPISKLLPSIAAAYLNSVPSGLLTDTAWQTRYDGTNAQLYQGATSFPATVTIQWTRPTRFDRVTVWSGMAWQAQAVLTDFDVQTSPDGSTWTTRGTYTSTSCASTAFAESGSGHACALETLWDEAWIHDFTFTPVTATYLRLNIRGVSFGGEPDSAAYAAGAHGQGGVQQVMLQEIGVYCDDQAVIPRWVTH